MNDGNTQANDIFGTQPCIFIALNLWVFVDGLNKWRHDNIRESRSTYICTILLNYQFSLSLVSVSDGG